MIFIFGTSNRTKTLASGMFTCPFCHAQRPYERKSTRPHISFYFIPLIPYGDTTEFIECQHCHHAYDPAILSHPTPRLTREARPLADQLNTLKQRLQDGVPIEWALADLTGAGLERTLAIQQVEQAVGRGRKLCPTCGLSYAETRQTCSEDATALQSE